jgi:hypothetical protein
MTEKERDRAIGVLEIIQKKCLEVKDIKDVSLYLKKMQEKCNLMHKFVKIEKVLLKIQIIFLFIILYLFFFKNIFILKLFIFVTSVIISIINFTLTLKSKKLWESLITKKINMQEEVEK